MDPLRSQLESALDNALSEDALKPTKEKLAKFFEEFHSDFEDRVRSYMSYNLAHYVQDMAKSAITAMLEGNETEMRTRLSCIEGRWTGRDREHPVIHGKLFEQGAVMLRKQIVEAHADLIKNERILDLEDQVKSLVLQNNKLEQEKSNMWDRVKDYMPR